MLEKIKGGDNMDVNYEEVMERLKNLSQEDRNQLLNAAAEEYDELCRQDTQEHCKRIYG